MTEQDYRDMLDEVCDAESGLSSREIEFIQSLTEWDGAFTDPQKDWLQKIYDRVC